MITNFETETADLDKAELKAVDDVVRFIKQVIPDHKPVKSQDLVRKLNQAFQENLIGFRLTDVKLRKYVNHIRSQSLLPVIATNKGYFISYKREDIEAQAASLQERENSLKAARTGLLTILTANT